MINSPRLSPFLRFFVRARGEPGNEASAKVCGQFFLTLFSYCNAYMYCMHILTINMQLSIAFDADARKVEHHGGDHE